MNAQTRSYVPLSTQTTLALPSTARFWLQIEAESELAFADSYLEQHRNALILGGGSNVVLATAEVAAILRIAIRGRRILGNDGERTIVEVGAGEIWHDTVCWCIEQGLYGLENLALIPGWVGGAPIQNIGAYGVELADRLIGVKAYDRQAKQTTWIDASDCGFAYRQSRFKTEPGRWLICAVRLALSKRFQPQLAYGDLQDAFAGRAQAQIRAHDVAESVMAIRRAKLPDPKVLANAGSFFKNPVVTAGHAEALVRAIPGLRAFADPHHPQRRKVSAARLIEAGGWKGFRIGDAGIYDHHALVVVNHAHATARDMLKLVAVIEADIYERFAVKLEPEPLIVH